VTAFKKSFPFGAHTVTLETGELARQANGAVVASMGDTRVLVTAVAAKEPTKGRDFFPLTVNYVEKTYAAGRIPGGFFRREGRPSEKETLTSRLIDRPIRPLFPDGFYNDVQVVATVLSLDPEIDADIPSLLGASAALAIAGVPFNGPIGAARVGYANGKYLLNPTAKELKASDLHLVVAGTKQAVLMVESEAKGLSEDVMLGAVVFGHTQMQVAIDAINALVKEAGKPRWDWKPEADSDELAAQVKHVAAASLAEAYRITEKQARYAKIAEAKALATATLTAGDTPKWTADQVDNALFKLESELVRVRILNGEPRAPHLGLDIAAPAGTPAGAAAPGIIRLAEPDLYFTGGSIVVDHGHTVMTFYIHLSRLLVRPGEEVAQGQPVGLVGMTGRATGPHLHLGLFWAGTALDPALVLPAR